MRGVLVLLALGLCVAHAKLPTGFIGHWKSDDITYAVPGPTRGFNFTILPLRSEDGNGWLMSDRFFGYTLTGSYQQFWVKSNDAGTNGTLTYCGILKAFYDRPHEYPTVQVVFQLTHQSSTKMQWHLSSSQLGWDGQWTLTLDNNGTELHSNLLLPSSQYVTHFDARFTRMDADPFPHVDEQTRALANAGHFAPPCNMSGAAEAGSEKAPKAVCPYGFTEKDGPMPQFVRNKLRKEALEAQAAKDAAVAKPSAKSADGYDHCFVINKVLNVTLQWTWNAKAQALDVLFSASVAKEKDPSTSYVAVGILPNWPAMEGMDIALGYLTPGGLGCVRSMYAKYYVGTPVENPSQALEETAVRREGDTLYVQFSRPFVTGHHNLTQPPSYRGIPSISWAIGRAPTLANCTGDPHYHGGHRGTMGVSWRNPDSIMGSYKKCSNQ